MKINLGKLLKGAVRAVKNNPELALMVVGAVAPKLAGKAAKVAAAAKAVE
jgi:hypothetical protein